MKVEPGSLALNVNDAESVSIVPDGPESIDVSGGVQSRTTSSAPMSRRAVPSQLPSTARGSPSKSMLPPGGATGFPASISGEVSCRWKLLTPGEGLTKPGAALVWNVWHGPPLVVGPRELVIVHAGSIRGKSIGSSITVESIVSTALLSSMSRPLP